MIVKNESHCISKCLKSIIPIINYWVICDTGSTDNTEEVVKQSLKDVPGEFHKHTWEDFSTNRNKALEISKQKSDYILIIDADDYLLINDYNIFKNLIHPAYYINIMHDPISYYRTQLISSKIDCKYIGVLHEYLELPNDITPITLHECKIVFGGTGSRSSDPNKYLKDAKILENALLKEPNNSRYVFYTAQSYKDAYILNKAYQLYLQRSAMGGWIEEIYISFLEAAKLLETIDPTQIVRIQELYIAAYNVNPNRSESLYYIASFCRRNELFNNAYMYSKIAIDIKKPQIGLFIEDSCYSWKIMDELAISSYYIGYIQESKKLNLKLLELPELPINERPRILNNLQFC